MKLLCTFLFFVTGFGLFGQQESIFRQFWNNTTHYSPGFSGLEYQHQAGAIFRHQWYGGKGTPQDVYGFYNTRIGKAVGTGINVSGGSSGFLNTYSASIPFSYHFNVSRKGKLGLGMALGLTHETANADDFILPQTEDDPVVENINEQDLQAHFGIAYKGEFLTAGFGMRNFTIASFGKTNAFKIEPHYYGLISLAVPVGSRSQYNSHSKMALEALYGYHNGFQSLQLDLRITHKDKLSVFGGYVWNQGVLLGGGWDFFGKFRTMYSVTWLNSKLNGGGRFTHEISLVYQLPHTD